jgi:hypothetical protein
MYIDKDYEASQERILNSNLPASEQRMLLKENEDRARKAIKGEAEINDPVALDRCNTAISQLGNNTITRDAAKKILNENRSKLKSSKADQLLNDLNREFDSSADSASANVRTRVRPLAIDKAKSAFDVLLEAFTKQQGLREQGKATDEDVQNAKVKLDTSETTYRLQLENFNRWEDWQQFWRKNNPGASPDAIEKEGLRSWYTDFEGKSTDQLKRESEEFKASFVVNQTGEVGPQAPEMVKVKHPDGRTGTVPADRVDELPSGWERL